MSIEVEQKFRVADLNGLEQQLAALGLSHPETVVQVDSYFAHPARNFAQTDEALRLRRVGDLNYITYKGPKLDATTKTRRELEIPLAAGRQAGTDAADLLQALGFSPVAEVRKRRAHGAINWQGRQVEVSLDHIAELGNFVELEIVTSEGGVALARECLASLAIQLGLSGGERRSYLEMLLAERK
jgi:adenylate cyclase class 2